MFAILVFLQGIITPHAGAAILFFLQGVVTPEASAAVASASGLTLTGYLVWTNREERKDRVSERALDRAAYDKLADRHEKLADKLTELTIAVNRNTDSLVLVAKK